MQRAKGLRHKGDTSGREERLCHMPKPQASETTRVFFARGGGRKPIQTLFSVSCEDLLCLLVF